MGVDHVNRRNAAIECLGFVAGAAALRVGFALIMQRVLDTADAVHYAELAGRYAQGDFGTLGDRIPPLYPALGALLSPLFPDVEWALRAVSLMAGPLLVGLLYLLALRLHGRAAARIVAILAVLWPWLIDYASRVAPEACACLLWFAAVYALGRALRDGGFWYACVPAAFLGLCLVRPEGPFLTLSAPVGALLFLRADARAGRRIAIAVLGIALALAFYLLFQKYMTGSAALSERVPNPVAALGSLLFERTALLARTFNTTLSHVIPVMLGPFLLMFAGCGLFMRGDAPRDLRFELLVLYFCLVQWALAVLSGFPEPRYLMAPIIAIALWSARGIVLVAAQAAALPSGRWLRPLPLALNAGLMVYGLLYATGPAYLGRLPSEPREYKIAGLWMREHLAAAPIVTRKPQIGYYADMPTLGPDPALSLERIVSDAHAAGARYVVVDERYTASLIPAFTSLLDPQTAPSSLKLLRDDLSPYAGGKVVIYEIAAP